MSRRTSLTAGVVVNDGLPVVASTGGPALTTNGGLPICIHDILCGPPALPIPKPDAEAIARIGRGLGFELSTPEAAAYARMMDGILESYGVVEGLPDFMPEPKYRRDAGHPPSLDENTLGAWSRMVKIKGSPGGRLFGKRIAIKDNIAIAGVPMRAGTRFFEVSPSVDATVVTRVLDAGCDIVGKANCEYLTLSGGSHTSLPAAVKNPWREGVSAGGSSSGSAVLIAAGEVDFGIGTDQGGSVRIPAAWCGIVGMKPTYGLVPYTGIMPLEWTLDHAGPMASTVADTALLLSVLAGSDGFDDRQREHPLEDYANGIDAGLQGLRIGVVLEGFGWADSEPENDRVVRESAARFRQLGATIEDVAVPAHRIARSIFTPTLVEGFLNTILAHDGAGISHSGVYDGAVTDAFARWRSSAAEFAPTVKVLALASNYISGTQGGRAFGKSQNLIRWLRAEYDKALARYDLLLMPTTPYKPSPLPAPDADDETVWNAALSMNINTAPFCATGHPAISLPCGRVDGLPIGLMLIGRMWDERTMLRAGHGFERSFDWRC